LVFADTSDNKNTELGNFFITGGYKFPINNDWTLQPSAFLKSSDMMFTSIQMDLTARMFYKEDYWAGISYRTGDAIITMFGLKYDRFIFWICL